MIFSTASDTIIIGVTRIMFNYILIKSFILYSAFTLILLIFVEGRLESLSVIIYLYPKIYLMLKSNSRIQTSYLIINTPDSFVPDLLN